LRESPNTSRRASDFGAGERGRFSPAEGPQGTRETIQAHSRNGSFLVFRVCGDEKEQGDGSSGVGMYLRFTRAKRLPAVTIHITEA
jgi:hypothetical protein